MCLSHARRTHQQQSLLRRPRIIPHKSLRQHLRLLHRRRMRRHPRLPIRQIRHITLKIAMLIPLRYLRALHHMRGPLFHPAIARARHLARRAIHPRLHPPPRPPAQRTIFYRHFFIANCSSPYKARPTAYERPPATARFAQDAIYFDSHIRFSSKSPRKACAKMHIHGGDI